MHSAEELRSSDFRVVVGSRHARLGDLFEGFGDQDRLGVVLGSPCGAAGAQRIREARTDLVEDDVPVESYRRISLDEALGLLQPGPSRFAD